MQDELPAIVFQSSIQSAGTLFGVFGFLYSVYAMFSNIAGARTAAELIPPPIVGSIRIFCRFLSFLILVNAGVSLYSVIRLPLNDVHDVALVLLSSIVSVGVAGFSVWWAFWKMRY